MISGNPINTKNGVGAAQQNSLGAAQDNTVSSGSGSWLGRTADNTPPHDFSTHHSPGPAYQGSDSVTKMRSAAVAVEASPDNGLRLPPDKLVKCQISLENGYIEVFGALHRMLLLSSMSRCSSILRKNLDILKTKEPFDEQIFLESAELLHADQSVIDDHQQHDKSVKIQLLEDLYRQRNDEPAEQRKHATSQMANLETIKQNFESYAPLDRLSCLPDPVPEHETAQMKDHVDALDTLLSSIDRGPLGPLIKADDSLQGMLSKVNAAVQECKNSLNRTNL
ncbi:hypothetical protein [Endozoicomonas sp. YOMI1]|uniref:hypothetical protein n=1 Tax=Endozoicomonas sp. YOMI1 TaxID=2828739 RepID=UPI0021490C80|nr:hypothetical protein [Endozoicomonas sp. YOMI1]